MRKPPCPDLVVDSVQVQLPGPRNLFGFGARAGIGGALHEGRRQHDHEPDGEQDQSGRADPFRGRNDSVENVDELQDDPGRTGVYGENSRRAGASEALPDSVVSHSAVHS